MNVDPAPVRLVSHATSARPPRSLLHRYIGSLVAVVGIPLLGYTGLVVWAAADEQRSALADVQRINAEAAAWRISQFVRELQGQLRWATHLSWDETDAEQHRVDGLRLLREVPAITDLTLIDGEGRERFFLSRVSMNRVGTHVDRSQEPAVRAASNSEIHFGPVHFRRGSEPYMTVALAGPRREAGVVLAEVDLAFTRDVVSQVRIGRTGQAYVVDQAGRLIAHPDSSLVLRNTDLSGMMRQIELRPGETLHRVPNVQGDPVLLAQAVAAPPGWRVLVELPMAEAEEPWRQAVWRSLAIAAFSLAGALAFAVGLSWRMVRPIRSLTAGAVRIGAGQLDHRIEIDSDDELGQLGRQFNAMAGELGRSYSTLERKVEERTQALAQSDQAKSRFLAAASHDLRQPLHALNLLVAQLREQLTPGQRERLTTQVEGAVASINGLLDGLLDISKLDAGVVAATPSDFPVQQVFDRVEVTFADAARARRLHLRVRPHAAWIRSDPVLLERILDNLVGNALRYTLSGGVLVGGRRRGDHLRIEVHDTGIGIAPDKQREIFGEFYQVAPAGAMRGEGLGLGLAIVARLGRLLEHPIEVASRPERGSCFSVTLPLAAAQERHPLDLAPVPEPHDALVGVRLLVVDNDDAVLESTAGLMRAWGCDVVAAASAATALQRLEAFAPALVIADVHLDDGEDGADLVAHLRARLGRNIPAILVSGDVSQATRDRIAQLGLPLLEKPVPPMRLRTLASRLLLAASRSEAGASPAA